MENGAAIPTFDFRDGDKLDCYRCGCNEFRISRELMPNGKVAIICTCVSEPCGARHAVAIY